MNNGIDDSQEVPDVDNITGIDNSIDDYVGTDGDDELIIVGCPGTVYGGGGNDGIWGNFYDDRFDGGGGRSPSGVKRLYKDGYLMTLVASRQ